MTLDSTTEHLAQLRDFLHNELLESVVPFWLRHAVDELGGINTCIRDNGAVINRDKYLWSQWRAVWVFSKLYNDVEPNSGWLELAEHIFQFTVQHGWDEDAGGWRLRLAADGRVLDAYDSIYVDAFAIYGLTEFAKATNRSEVVELARRTADSVLVRLKEPHDRIPHAPYPVPNGARVHGLPMIFSLVFWELGQFLDDDTYKATGLSLADDVFDNFYKSDRDLVLERIATDNSEFSAPLGTAVVPGHVIEGMWFQIHIATDTGSRQRIDEACRLIKRHCEAGWDNDYGGLLLGIDAEGSNNVGWDFHDTKLWWPHTEAMYALLLAYEHTDDPAFLTWYDRIHNYAFEHFPVAEHGEWTQKLDRRGKPIKDIVCLPVKDPFHLPRALIYCTEVLDRLIKKRTS